MLSGRDLDLLTGRCTVRRVQYGIMDLDYQIEVLRAERCVVCASIGFTDYNRLGRITEISTRT